MVLRQSQSSARGMTMISVATFSILVGLSNPEVMGMNTWCGKNYATGDPIIPPEGRFPVSEDLGRLESFRCVARIQPYLEDDLCSSPASVLFDIPRGFSQQYADLTLIIDVEGHRVVHREVEANTMNLELPLSFCGVLVPRKKPYVMTCLAKLENPNIHLNENSVYVSTFSYLPNPQTGSVTKLDRKTGALMTNSKGVFEPIFPIGFYTDFGGYLANNLSILDELKEQGFNTIHPVPPFDDVVAFNGILDHMDSIGLYLIYDMRHTYQNLLSISQEIAQLRHRKSLLLWYTADEPDGPGDPLDATWRAYDLIHKLDGYHPVSLALNCADHFFKEYVSGADIILPDIYMIGNNATFSSKYNTPCTQDFGCCGCDNCRGRFEDISERLDDTNARLRSLGWDKTKFVWAVTQAFGGEEFWTRPPTGKEWLMQAIMSINHGARGIIPWIDPTPPEIKVAASRLAKVLPQIVPFLFDSEVSFIRSPQNRVDTGFWKKGSNLLVLATNMDSDSFATVSLPSLDDKHIAWLLKEDASLTSGGTLFVQSLGSAIIVISNTTEDNIFEHDEL